MPITNIGGLELGSIILGVNNNSVTNETVSQTLTFSQVVGHNFQALTQNLTFNETISFQHVYGRTVSESLTFSQNIKIIVPQTISQSLTFTESQTFTKFKVQSLSQSLTLTETIADSHIAVPIVVQGFFPVQQIIKAGVYLRPINESLTFTQNIRGDYCKVVNNTLSFAQTVSYTKNKVIRQNFELQQSFINPTSFVRTINSIFIPFQTINKTIKFNQSINQSLTFNQTIIEARVKFVTQILNLTQSIVAYRANSVKNTLTLSQNISYNHNVNAPVKSLLALSQTIGIARTKTFKIHHGFGMNSFITSHSVVHTQVYTDNLTLAQQIRFNVYNRAINETLTFNQTIGFVHPIYETIQQNLGLTQIATNHATIKKSVTNVLTFQTSRPVYLGMVDCKTINVDNLQYALIPHNPGGAYRAKNRAFCVLQTYNTVVTVPTPDWNDTENYNGIFTIRRSMNGIPYTYVRVLELRKLRLPFTLDAAKGEELLKFLLDADAKIINLTTWKGDKWIVHLTSNPVELSRRGRYANAYERAEISVEFEGYKVM